MAKILNLDEMQEIMQSEGLPGAHFFKTALETIGTEMARVLADHLKLSASEARCEGTAFAGTCAAFRPLVEGDPCPEALQDYDTEADWMTEDEFRMVCGLATRGDATDAELHDDEDEGEAPR